MPIRPANKIEKLSEYKKNLRKRRTIESLKDTFIPYRMKIREDFNSIKKIKDKDTRNLLIKSYLDIYMEENRGDVWTKIIMIINIGFLAVNFIILLLNSELSMINPVFTSLVQERIKNFGAENVSQQFGIDYNNLPQAYSSLGNSYTSFIQSLIPYAIWSTLILFLLGAIYFIIQTWSRHIVFNNIKEQLLKAKK
jgi:hypothetical protein